MSKNGLVTFSIGQRRFGIKLEFFYKIISGQVPVTFLPGAPDYIEGIINFLGEIVPIISVERFLDIKSQYVKSEKNILILQKEKDRIGLLIEGRIDFIKEAKDIQDIELIDVEKFLTRR